MLATAAHDQPFNWEEHLRSLCIAHNSSVHPTTGYTPFYFTFGWQARMPVDVMNGSPNPGPTSPSEYAAHLQHVLRKAYDKVQTTMSRELDRYADLYNAKKIHGCSFKPGDLVWLHSPAVGRGLSKKLHKPWTGPYKVVDRLSETTYKIQNCNNRCRILIVHFNRLKMCSLNVRLPNTSRYSSQHQDSTNHPSRNRHRGYDVTLIDDDNHPYAQPPPAQQPYYPRRARQPPDYLIQSLPTPNSGQIRLEGGSCVAEHL